MTKPIDYEALDKFATKIVSDDIYPIYVQSFAFAYRELRAIIKQHDLCHNLGKVDARAFADGCAEEQRKLYGCAPDADELVNFSDAVAELTMERDQLRADRERLLALVRQIAATGVYKSFDEWQWAIAKAKKVEVLKRILVGSL